MNFLHILSEAWPIVTGLLFGFAGAVAWAGKVFFMLKGIEAKIDCMGQNIATHEHDPDGRVIIPAR
tara:strand:- start:7195 stop:7392 length:198 start_codon:yes stop_codon:yes gene_type:complete